MYSSIELPLLTTSASCFPTVNSTPTTSCLTHAKRRPACRRLRSWLRYTILSPTHFKHIRTKRCLQANVVEIKVVKGSEAFNEALLKEKPRWGSLITWQLVGCLLLGCFAQTMNGFDGSLFNGLNSNKQFLAFFHGETSGEWQAINAAMYQIGGICALPFVGPAIDTWGRKIGMAIGAWIIILGCIINGTTLYNPGAIGQLQAGRFILGFGVSIISAAGPIYVVETAHPAWRGIITAYCNTFWFTGSILCAGAVRGAIVLKGNISWQIPVWLQVYMLYTS